MKVFLPEIRWISQRLSSGFNEHGWLENGPVEDLFPIKNVEFPACHVSLLEGFSGYTISSLREVVVFKKVSQVESSQTMVSW